MIYVTGDTHGDEKIFSERKLGHLKKSDILIITGDFGFVWDNSKEEIKSLKKLSKKKFTVFFVEGAHENFARLKEFEEVDFCGGKARKISENIYCAQRGEIYTVEGRRVFTLGGGLAPYAQEDDAIDPLALPNDDELQHAVDQIQSAGRHVDIIITHEPPASVKRMIDRNATVNDLNIFLDTVLHNTRYGKWYFGALHRDRAVSDRLICVFEDVHKAG